MKQISLDQAKKIMLVGPVINENLQRELGILFEGIKNIEKVGLYDGHLVVTMALCPLYRENGDLVQPGDNLGITESRIGIKYREQMGTMGLISEFAVENSVRALFVMNYADMGVIVSTKNQLKVDTAIDYHEILYRNALDKLDLPNCKYVFRRYSFLEPHGKKTIISDAMTGMDIVEIVKKLINQGLVDKSDVLTTDGNLSQRLRRRIKSLCKFGGYEVGMGFLEHYLLFKRLTASEPENGLHLYFERVPYLLTDINTLARNSPQSVNPRVEILC